MCQEGGRKSSFLCPNGTLFNQKVYVCDWWHNVDCSGSSSHFELNSKLYEYGTRISTSNQNRGVRRTGTEEEIKDSPETSSPSTTANSEIEEDDEEESEGTEKEGIESGRVYFDEEKSDDDEPQEEPSNNRYRSSPTYGSRYKSRTANIF